MAYFIDGLNFYQLDSVDLDFVCGGAKVSNDIATDELLKVEPSHKCNCSEFVRSNNCGNIDICDNCSHALTPYCGSNDIYCSCQSKN